MTKLKYKGFSKSPTRSLYAFPKVQEFFSFMLNVLLGLGFKENGDITGFGRPCGNERQKPIWWKEFDINLSIFDQKLINFSNKEYSIDIVFFSEKIVVIFNHKRYRQQKLTELIEKERKKAKAPKKSEIETNENIGHYF